MTFEASISGKNIRDLGGAAIRRWAIAGFRGAWAATNDSPRFFCLPRPRLPTGAAVAACIGIAQVVATLTY
jgi:hypothetical protein